MNVQEFVRDVLLQMINGVEDTQKIYPPVFAPAGYTGAASINPTTSRGLPAVQVVELDMSVEVSSAADGKSGFHVAIGGVGFGRDGGGATSSTTVASRVRFSVPIYLPGGRPS